MTTATDILDRAIAIGNQKSAAASDAAAAATSAAQGVNFLSAPYIVGPSNAVEPNVYIPSGAAGVDQGLFNSTYDKIINDLGNKFGAFFAQYFPVDAQLLQDVNNWLKNAIENGGSGVNAAVENKIWQRDQDRITRQAAVASDQAVSQWAARGFPLPPGAAIAAVQQIQRDRDSKLFDASRDRAIKSWEMEYENVKFAITTAIDMRVKAVSAASDFIRTIALAPQIAATMSTAALNAQANLINAATGFYNARIRVQELNLDVVKSNANLQLSAGSKNMDGFNSRIAVQAQTAVAVAQSLGSQAASALNAVNGTAQIIQSL